VRGSIEQIINTNTLDLNIIYELNKKGKPSGSIACIKNGSLGFIEAVYQWSRKMPHQ